MISQVLYKKDSKQVGLFSSPHLFEPNERIQVNWVPISDKDFDKRLWEVFTKQKKLWLTTSYFEAIFIASILYFRSLEVDYAVIEVGLWWTLDATNVFHLPVCTVITHIWFDHTHILGATRSQIQRNKMGIMKKWIPCFTSVDNKLMEHGARVKWAILHVSKNKKPTNLHGAHQEENAWIAFDVLKYLWYDDEEILSGLQDITHRWRCERLSDNLLIDWAHNKSWLFSLATYVDSVRGDFDTLVTVFGTVKNKDFYEEYIKEYLIEGEKNYFVQIDSERAVDITELSAPFQMQYLKSLEQIIRKSEKNMKTLYVIYGSLYLIWEVIQIDEMRKKNEIVVSTNLFEGV